MKPKIRTSLENTYESAENEEEKQDKRTELWRKHGDLVIMKYQIAKMSNFYRMMVEAIGNLLYGKRDG